MSERAVAELIVHLGRITHGNGFVVGLTPLQWTALRYFARANRFSPTPSAFAEFHGTTRGTASQTTKSLVAQGYLVRTRSEADGRSARLDLTDKARAITFRYRTRSWTVVVEPDGTLAEPLAASNKALPAKNDRLNLLDLVRRAS